jgi:hypothetical protein
VLRYLLGGLRLLAWSCTGLLALTWTACSSEPRPPQSTASAHRATEEVRGEPCTHDGDCASLFCDRGVCAEPETKGNYGASCEPPAPIVHRPPPGPDTPATWSRAFSPENKCGSYLCIDKRCRSCQSDAECKPLSGAKAICDRFSDRTGTWPGKGCGVHVTEQKDPAAPPPAESAPYPRDP